MNFIKILLILLNLFLILPINSNADSITFYLNYTFSGDSPQGSPPWLVANFEDIGTNWVKLTLRATGLINNEFIKGGTKESKGWFFNFNDNLDLNLLSFEYKEGEKASEIGKSKNSYKADGDGEFDILFSWENKFIKDSYVIYEITSSTQNFSAIDFKFFSNQGGGEGIYYSAAHIQGIEIGKSGWIGAKEVTVPEAGIFMLLGLGLSAVGVGRRWMRKNKNL